MLVAKKKPTTGDSWAERLKAMRDRLGLTQVQAAERADIAVRTWVSWETGTRKPGRMALKLLRAAFPELK